MEWRLIEEAKAKLRAVESGKEKKKYSKLKACKTVFRKLQKTRKNTKKYLE